MLKYFGNSFFIAEFNNKIVGFILGFKSQVDSNKFFIMQIVIFSKFRYCEIGKLLIDKMENVAEDLNCQYMELMIDSNNIQYQRLFSKIGYVDNSSNKSIKIEDLTKISAEDSYQKQDHPLFYRKNLD
jgi:ribosomal protein S18 acetylase RimI-like enzyme